MEDYRVFKNRTAAGFELAKALSDGRKYSTVLGIPRGGLEVAAPIAASLEIPLDAIVTRKLPIPWSPEAGFGAVTDDGTTIIDEGTVRAIGLTEDEIRDISASVYKEVRRRRQLYRGDKPETDITDKHVLIVDDGLATGYTMLAAVRSAKSKGAKSVTVAVPVTSDSGRRLIKPEVDEFITLIDSAAMPFAVAMFYLEWRDLTDSQVFDLLDSAQQQQQGRP